MARFSVPIVGTSPRTSQSKFIVQAGVDLSPMQQQMKSMCIGFPPRCTVSDVPPDFEVPQESPTIQPPIP